jgi:hypothetical protein
MFAHDYLGGFHHVSGTAVIAQTLPNLQNSVFGRLG